MKIDLKKLQEVYKKFKDTPTIDAIKLMITQVLSFSDAPYNLAPNNVRISINTLIELGVLILDDKAKISVQQLNS